MGIPTNTERVKESCIPNSKPKQPNAHASTYLSKQIKYIKHNLGKLLAKSWSTRTMIWGIKLLLNYAFKMFIK